MSQSSRKRGVVQKDKAGPRKSPAKATKEPPKASPPAAVAETVPQTKAAPEKVTKPIEPPPPPKEPRKVYSPADEALKFTYRARPFSLVPNTVQTIASPWGDVIADVIVDYVLEFFKRVGVREVFGDERDEAIKAEAEVAHADWLREVAGLAKPVPDSNVVAARAALAKRGLLPTGGNE